MTRLGQSSGVNCHLVQVGQDMKWFALTCHQVRIGVSSRLDGDKPVRQTIRIVVGRAVTRNRWG
jgi:hypothetical protein